MAPFTPFLAEYMYQILRKLMPQSSTPSEVELSVHFQMIPKSQLVLSFFSNLKKTIVFLENLW